MIQYKLVSIEYFMDTLQDWEVYDIYKLIQYADTNQWEMTRWLMYVVAQVNSRKKLEMTDILKFPWDPDQEEHDTNISNEDIIRLKALSEKYAKNMKQ